MSDSALDTTAGKFTTGKLQALLDAGKNPQIRNRRDLAEHLSALGAQITVHGVEAWFRRVDSNYNQPRKSLSDTEPSFGVPARHWPLLLELFGLQANTLDENDTGFARDALAEVAAGEAKAVTPVERGAADHLQGRSVELEALLGVLEESTAHMVLLEGSAGLGKTSLLEELVQRTRASGRLCVTASALENSYVPLLPLLDLIRLQPDEIARGGARALQLAEQLARHIEQANTDAGSKSAATQDSSSLFLLGSDLLVALARHAPLLVVIDDVHWLDEATQDLLVHFARFLRLNREHRVSLVLAGRPPMRQLLHQLPGGEFRQHLTLAPLSPGAMRRAVRRLLGADLDPQARDYVWNITEGNPLYVEQLTAHLAASKQLKEHHNVYALVGPADSIVVPETLDDFYRRRFDALDSSASRLLQLASCVGQQVNGEFLQLLMPGTDTSALMGGLARAENAGLLKFSRNAYAFAHPVARHAVYVAASETERAQQHADIARAIAASVDTQTPHAAIELAYHLVQGRPHTDARVTLFACRDAARHSFRLAGYPNAEFLTTQALDLCDAVGGLDENERGELLHIRGASRHQSARPTLALDDLEAALERFEAGQNTAEYTRTLSEVVRVRANFLEVREGQNESARELASYVERLGKADNEVAAVALEVLASYRLANKDSRGARVLAERVIADYGQGVAALDTEKVLHSRITAGIACLDHLDIRGGLAYLRDAVQLARQCHSVTRLVRALQRLVIALFVLGRVDEVLAAQEELESLRGVTTTGEHSAACTAIAAALAVRGRYAESLAVTADGLELVDVTGYRFMEPVLVGCQVYCLLQKGDTAAAEEAIDRLELERPRRAAQLLRGEVALARVRNRQTPLTELDGGSSVYPGMTGAVSEGALDFSELARVMMLTELALANNDLEVLAGVLPKLEEAEQAGIVFSTAWPVSVPLLLGRVCLRLNTERDAYYHFRHALDYASGENLPLQLTALQQVLQDEWPQETQLQALLDAALAGC